MPYKQITNSDKTARNTFIDPATGLLFNHDYEVRDTTPELRDHDHILSSPGFYASKPVVLDRKASASSTSSSLVNLDLDLDLSFIQRQEERSERYHRLGVVPNADWKSNQEKIIQSIELTVAKMTRNYHSSSEEFTSCTATDTFNEPDITVGDTPVGCALRFCENDKEVWDTVRIGNRLLTHVITPSCDSYSRVYITY